MEKSSITVIIPTYRPGKDLRELLRRIFAQSTPPAQVLVINTLEEDGGGASRRLLQELERSYSRLRVIHIPKEAFDHGGTRDLGARLCKTELMVFLTMDALPADRNLLRELALGFDREDVACVYGRQLPARDADALERFGRAFNYPAKSARKTKADLQRLGIKTYFCSNVCAAYRRDLYFTLGGFEKHTIFNEDMIFAGHAIQAGYAVIYRAGARVIHSHNYTGPQQFHRNFDLGVSQAQHPEVFSQAVSETEGLKMIRRSAAFLLRTGNARLLGRLVWISGCKYLGYRLGKAYRVLPRRLVLRCSMNPGYWSGERQGCLRRESF